MRISMKDSLNSYNQIVIASMRILKTLKVIALLYLNQESL